MEDNMEVLKEETIPTAEQPSEAADADELEGQPQPDNKDEELPEGADNPEAKEDAELDADFLPITFMDEQRTLNRADAIKYAKMGMNHERFEPLIAKLDYLAAIKGVTREELIEGHLKAQEDAMRDEIISRYGDDENIVNEMIEFTKQKHQKAYEAMIAKEQKAKEDAELNTNTRLAEEYVGLVKEFPELEGKEFKDLPAAVKKAGYAGEKLLNAYLYHKHSENKKISEAQNTAEKQNKSSAGSMQGEEANAPSQEESNFLNALWGK